jgi:hypothetical protein
MADPVVSSQGIRPAESLLLRAKVAANLLLSGIVDGVLVPGKIVGPREYCIAGLSSARVDSVATMWTCLAIQ